jgi:hypothetical protein
MSTVRTGCAQRIRVKETTPGPCPQRRTARAPQPSRVRSSSVINRVI